MTNGIGRVGWRNFVPTENPLWDNLKAYFTGDNTANDSKGTNNGTLVNGATYGTGKIGSGFSLDGINDSVGFASNWFRKSKTEPFTISSWVNSSVNSIQVIFSNGNDGGHLLFIYGQYIHLQMGAGLYGGIRVVSASPIPLNTFKHITITYNGNCTLSGFKIYIDGVSVGVNIAIGEYGPLNYLASNDTPAIASIPRIGSLPNGSYPFAGVLDEVGIWDRALTAADATELYNGGAGKQYVAPAPAYTARTTAFAAATGITDTTILNALNTFDTGLISNGLATKMKAVYPFVGTTATTQKFNFMDARDLNAAFRLQFNGGITFTSNGILFGGDNGFANTFLQPSSILSLNDTHISLYSRTNNSNQIFDIQCTATPSLDIAMWGGTTFYNVNQALNYSTYSDGSTLGFRLINRTSSVSEKLFKNNSLVATVTNASNSLSPGVIDIGRYYLGGYYSNRNYAFISIGNGLTDAEALTFYNLVQTMQTSLSRQV